MKSGNSNNSGGQPDKFRRGTPPLKVLVQHQVPIFKEILQNEIYYEGERRNRPVDPNDPDVQQRVAEIIIRKKAYIMERARAECPAYDHEEFIRCEREILKEILRNERWYLSEARNEDVGENNKEVYDKALDIVITSRDDIRKHAFHKTFRVA